MTTSRIATRWILPLGLAAAVLVGSVPAESADRPVGTEPYMKEPQGPYRGRVVDAVTRQPLKGVLVWVVWQAEDPQIEGLRHLVAAREMQTNARGEFFLDASAVETKPRFLAFAPRFFLFAHGYTPVPEEARFPVGAPASQFRGRGSIIAMQPATTPEARTHSFNVLVDSLKRVGGTEATPPTGDQPEMVLLGQFVQDELKALGFKEDERGVWRPSMEPPGRDVAAEPSPRPAPRQSGAAAGGKKKEELVDARFLRGYEGPYRGRVVDAETKAPIAGAVVLAEWVRDKEELLRTHMVFYDARELITDANGEWVMHAEDIERRAPPDTLKPSFRIFYPGYGTFPEKAKWPGIFGTGVTVELPQMKTREERLRVLDGVPEGFTPYERRPNWMRLMNVERLNLGLKPADFRALPR